MDDGFIPGLCVGIGIFVIAAVLLALTRPAPVTDRYADCRKIAAIEVCVKHVGLEAK